MTLQADGDITIKDGTGAGDATPGKVKAQTGSVSVHAVNAASSILVQDTATVQADDSVTMIAGNGITVQDKANVLAAGTDVAVPANTFYAWAQNGSFVVNGVGGNANVIAGVVGTDGSHGAAKNATVLAKNNITVQGKGQFAAAGAVDLDATTGDIVVENDGKLGAGEELTADAGGAIRFSNKAVVASDKTVAAVAHGTTFTVEDDAQLIATKSITAIAKTAFNVDDNAKVRAGKTAGTDDDANVALTAQTGAMSIDGEVQARGNVTLQADGDITIKDGTGAGDTTKGLVKAQTGTVTIYADAAGTAGSLTIKEDAKVEAAKNVAVVAGKDITVRDNANVLAGNKGAAAEAIKLDAVNGAISVDGTVVATADDVKLEAKGAVLVSDKAATAPLATDTVNGFVQAKAGDVTIESETASVTVQDNTKVLAGVNDDATFTVATAGKSVTLSAAKTSGAGSISVRDNAVVAGSQDVVANAQGAIDVLGNAQVLAKANDAKLTADTGAIYVDGVVEAGNDVSIVATAGNVTIEDKLAGTTDTTKGLVKADAGKVEISAGAAGTTASVTVREDATVQAAKNVSVVAGNNITVRDTADVLAGNKGAATEAIKLDAKNGAISVDGTVVATADDVKLNAGTSVTVKDDNGAADGQKGLVQATAGAVDIAAVNAITVTDTADVTAGTTVDIKSTGLGAIRIDTTGSVTANDGNVTIQNDQGNVTIQNATVEAKKGPVVTAASGKANVAITATKGTVTIAKGTTQSATVRAAADVTIAASDDPATPATVEGNVWVDESTVEATAGDVLVGTSAAKVSSVTVRNGATVKAGKSVKAYAADNVSLLDGTGATKVTANDGDVVIDAEDGVSVAGADITATDAGSGAGNVEISAAGANGGYAIAVAGDATITADKAVTAKATAATTAGDISITTTGTVLAKNGNVTIDNDSGTVAIANGTVQANVDATATTPATAANVDIDATAGVTIDGNAQVVADNSVTIDNAASAVSGPATGDITIGKAGDTTTLVQAKGTAATDSLAINNAAAASPTDGSVKTDAGAKIDAKSGLAVSATQDIDAQGVVEATGATTLAADGKVEAGNANNDFGGAVTVTGTTPGTTKAGAVTLKDKDDITVAGIDAAGAVDVDGATGVTVSGPVTTTAADGAASAIDIAAATGDVNINANVDAVNGSANVTATAGNIASAAGATVGAANTVNATATAGNVDVAVDANSVNVTAGGDVKETIVAGTHNPTGDLNINADSTTPGKSSVVAGGNLDINVAGKISTSDGAEIHAGGNLDVKASTASSPLNVNVGGSTIGVDLANQDAVAINDHGKQYTVKGNNSHTAIFIDGRLAGGDSRYFSILNSYEAESGRGVVSGPLPVPFVFNMFTAPFYTMDLPFGAPANLGQSYMSDEAGTIDAGDEFPDTDKSLSIPGLPKNSTIFFGTSNDGDKKDGDNKGDGVAML